MSYPGHAFLPPFRPFALLRSASTKKFSTRPELAYSYGVLNYKKVLSPASVEQRECTQTSNVFGIFSLENSKNMAVPSYQQVCVVTSYALF